MSHFLLLVGSLLVGVVVAVQIDRLASGPKSWRELRMRFALSLGLLVVWLVVVLWGQL